MPENPDPSWISEKMLGEIFRMSNLKPFNGFLDHFIKNVETYKTMYDDQEPQNFILPGEW